MSHKEMLVFVQHMMSVQCPTNFNKGMQILGKLNLITMLQIEVKILSGRNNSRQNWSRQNGSK